MTPRQLEQVEQDYAAYLPPHWHVIASEAFYPTPAELRAAAECAICGQALREAVEHRRITWRPAGALRHLHHLSAVVCRNGVVCRRERDRKDAALEALRAT